MKASLNEAERHPKSRLLEKGFHLYPILRYRRRHIADDSSYLIIDRDTKHLPLCEILESTDTDVVTLPPKSPNLNSHLERFMRSLKSECLDRMILFGETSLRRALKQFSEHYHHERNHQGLDNRIIEPGDEVGRANGEIQDRERLGGILRYYYRKAA